MIYLHTLDAELFAAINRLAGHWLWLDNLARLFANDYFVPTLLGIILLALWFERQTPPARTLSQQAALVGALSAGLGNILLKLINLLYDRPRPFLEQPVNLLFYRPTDPSLPSNAAVLGFSIAAGVWFYRPGWGWGLFGVAGLFGLSRIFSGVHYPLDVLSGALLGIGAAWLVQRQKTVIGTILSSMLILARRLGVA